MPPKTALIVDDDSLFCWALQKELTLCGLRTSIASTGHEGLVMMRKQQFDLLFLDVHLPDGNGIELHSSLRSVSPGTRTVIVSWDGSEANKEDALASGAEQFLEKPFEIGVVRRFLSGALRDSPCQRKKLRYLCNFPLLLSILSPSPDEAQFDLASMQCIAEDIGEAGICLTTSYPLRPGQEVRLRVGGDPDPFGKMLPSDAYAAVVWSRRHGQQATAGLRFLPRSPLSA